MSSSQQPQRSARPVIPNYALFALALLPALVMVIAAIRNNQFALLDDGVTILSARGPVGNYFNIGESGRFMPMYWMFYWAVFKILPEQAWALSLGNGLCVLAAAGLIFHLAWRFSGAVSGVVAAWLFTLNLATVENLFTLSKAESKQLPFWIAAVALLVALIPAEARVRVWHLLCLSVFSALTILFKETGVLLAIPVVLYGLHAILIRKGLAAGELRRRLILVACGLAPLAVCLIPILLRGFAAGSYARSHMMAGQSALSIHLMPLLEKDPQLAALLIAGALCGAAQWVTERSARRFIALLLLAQLLAILAFFTILPDLHAYYLHAAAAFAALLIGTALPALSRAAAPVRVAGCALLLALTAWGVTTSVNGASALSAWNWLYGRLADTVSAERPTRVLFHNSGGPEVHFEADLTWRRILNVPVQVGLLDAPAEVEPSMLHVSSRDLQAGDWILEQFGTPVNVTLPFRDLGIAYPEDHALLREDGGSLLPVRLIHRFKATFSSPHPPFRKALRGSTFLSWRIYEVTEPPIVALEEIGVDRWMFKNATLWIRNDVKRPLTLRMRAYAPPGPDFANKLYFYAGESKLAECPATTGIMTCRFDPSLLPAGGSPGGWTPVELRAEKTFSPKALGISDDPRDFSFSYEPTYAAGSEGLFNP